MSNSHNGVSNQARESILARLPTAPPDTPQIQRVDIKTGGVSDWVHRLTTVQATVAQVADDDGLLEAVTAQLLAWGQTRAVMSENCARVLLEGLASAGLSVKAGQVTGDDRVGIVQAYAGAIEQGAVVMVSSRELPVRNVFLPEYSLIVLEKARLLPNLEAIWQLMRGEKQNTLTPTDQQNTPPVMPRSVNIVTGPSKTADIEQTIVYGAHGPKELHVILVG